MNVSNMLNKSQFQDIGGQYKGQSISAQTSSKVKYPATSKNKKHQQTNQS